MIDPTSSRLSQVYQVPRTWSSAGNASHKKVSSNGKAENASRNEKRNHNDGTLRSIPIKDYRASLVHNMETLRRSVVPQQQFESLVSEPERNLRLANKRRSRLNFNNSTSPKAEADSSRTSRVAKNRLDIPSRCSRTRRSDRKSNGERHNEIRTIEFVPNFRFMDEPVELFVDSGFHSRRTSSRRRDARSERRTPVMDETPKNRRSSNEVRRTENGASETMRDESVDLERGNVCKKISVYEGNVRTSGRSEQEIIGQGLNGSGDGKRHRAIGVPLVGMHNACGLPVIAHWPNHRVFGTLRLPDKIVGGLRRAANRPKNLDRRGGTHSKRKPPSSQSKHLREGDEEELPVSERTEESTGSVTRKRILKRPSFKAGRTNAMPYKQRYNRRNDVKMTTLERKTLATGGTLGKRTTARRSVKRSTLYAKDEGNEAAEVLTNLCLNPLARNKGASNMIW